MKSIHAKEHTDKYRKIALDAAKGQYPNEKVAKVGSKVGLGIGGALCCAGIYGLSQSAIFGIGSLAAGGLTIASNMINLKRIKPEY